MTLSSPIFIFPSQATPSGMQSSYDSWVRRRPELSREVMGMLTSVNFRFDAHRHLRIENNTISASEDRIPSSLRSKYTEASGSIMDEEQQTCLQVGANLKSRHRWPVDIFISRSLLAEDVDHLMDHINDPNYDLKQPAPSAEDMEMIPSRMDPEAPFKLEGCSTSRTASRSSAVIDFDE